MVPYLIIQAIPEQHRAKERNQELQKTNILGTAHIIRQVLIIIKKERENMHTDRCVSTSGQESGAKGIRKGNITRVYT